MHDPITASTASTASSASSQPSSFPPPSIPPTLEARISAYQTNALPTDYSFDPSLSIDDNYMVLTLIYARLSMSKRGNMACIVVGPDAGAGREEKEVEGKPPAKRARREEEEEDGFPNYPGRILSHSNNFPQPTSAPSASTSTSSAPDGTDPPKKPSLKPGKQPRQPKPGQSAFLACAAVAPELHAEARAICLAAARGVSLAGSTAYVSFPPCQHCLPLLVAAGFRRLVYRQRMTTGSSVELCRLEGVECVEYTDKKVDEALKERVGRWWKERGEGREETRGRMEKWWREAEERVMGKLAGEAEAKEQVEEVNGDGQAEGDALPVDLVATTIS